MDVTKKTVDDAERINEQARRLMEQARKFRQEMETADPTVKDKLEQAVRDYAERARDLSRIARQMVSEK